MNRKNLRDETMNLHRAFQGKIGIHGKVPMNTGVDLSLAYTPGVGDICKAIAENPAEADELTAKGNMVAVVTDGSAVLGLGDIGPKAAMPVMEGKSLLFKKFAGVDAFPICLDARSADEIVAHVKAIAPGFAGINLEDIAAPKCFEVEARLKKELDIPVFHDDQHGTAIVVLAAMLNALRYTGKSKESNKVVINGAGAAGLAIAELLLYAGFGDVTLVSLEGVVGKEEQWLNNKQKTLSEETNKRNIRGDLDDVIEGADAFIGVSAPGVLSKQQVAKMNEGSVVFALANPVPEIYPEDAREAGAEVIGTGRSDYPNQINNLLAFPGIFKGALESKVSDITKDMEVAAAEGIASLVTDEQLTSDYIIPSALDKTVARKVSEAIKKSVEEDRVLLAK